MSTLSAEADKVAAVRLALPATSAGIYLNAGTCGPLPAETAAAMAELADWEVRLGRASPDTYFDVLQRMEEARASIAAIIAADTRDIALTHSASEAMNVAVWGIDWRPGDRAVTAGQFEHPGGLSVLSPFATGWASSSISWTLATAATTIRSSPRSTLRSGPAPGW